MQDNLSFKRWLHLIFIIIMGTFLYGYNLDGWDLWNPDEPRYAQIAREMLETGNWILPHLNSEVYSDKPPLVFWLIASSFKIFGNISEVTARFPIVLLAIIGLVLTYILGKNFFDQKTGLLSSLIVATTIEYFWLSRRVALDIPLTFFILLAFLAFYHGYQKLEHCCRYSLLFFCFMSLATLAKGPVGFIIPLLTVIIYLSLKREIHIFKEMRFGRGSLIFLIILALWLVPAGVQGGKGYLLEIVFHQTLIRFTDSWAHRQPFYYYFEVFPAGFAPWTLFLPAALIWCFLGWKERRSGDHLFPLIWFLVVFIFFTCSSGKRELYLLPLYPAAAMITGKYWADCLFHPEQKFLKYSLRLTLLILAVTLLGGAVLSFFIEEKFHPFLKSIPPINVFPISIAFAICGIFLFMMLKRAKICFYLILGMIVYVMLYSVRIVMPQINFIKSAKPLSSEILSLMRAGDELFIYKKEPSAFNFYTGIYPIRQLKSQDELKNIFTSEKKIFCLMYIKDFERLKESQNNLYPLRLAKIGHREFVLITNRKFIN